MRVNDWPRRALCRPEEAPQWTSDTPPSRSDMAYMESTCARCPVSSACAQHALDTSVHAWSPGGVYAGVWLPSGLDRHRDEIRDAARTQLKKRAGGHLHG